MVFAVVADLGQTLDSVSTVNHMLQDTDAQMLLHAGTIQPPKSHPL
jgi:hypothetical protein